MPISDEAAADGSLPEPVLRYIIAIRPIHDGLRRALIHLSGFALEQITKTGHRFIGHGLVESARLAFAEISDGLRSITVPDASTHHMTHLRGAATAIESGIRTALSITDPEGDRLLHALEQANHHLRAANRCLPGTTNVDLTQSCCAGAASHTTVRPTKTPNGRRHGQLLDLGPGLRGSQQIPAERDALRTAISRHT
ncbi:MAG: hypothetical protein U1E67_13095 [Hyphomicrobiales bacterium]